MSPASERFRAVLTAPGTVQGIAFMATSAFAVTLIHVVVRLVSGEVHPFEAVLFRSLFSLVVLAPVIWRNARGVLATRRLPLLAGRAALESGAALTFFLALTLTGLAKITVISFSAPLWATLLAVFVMGETLRLRRMAALAVGFAGVLVVLRPGTVAWDMGSLLALAGAATWGTGMIATKLLSRTEPSLRISFYSALFTVPIALIAAVPVWTWPSFENLAWLAALGLLSAIRQWTVAESFKRADATAVLPADYTQLVWAALFGYLMFAEVPDAMTWIGGAMIAGSVFYVAWRERSRRPTDGR